MYRINLRITAKNRFGLFGDISSIIYRYADDVTYMKGWASKSNEQAFFDIQILVEELNTVGTIFDELEQFDDIYGVYPVYNKGIFTFIFACIFTLAAWIANPFLVKAIVDNGVLKANTLIFSNLLVFFDVGILMFMLIYTANLFKKYFPSVRNLFIHWIVTGGLTVVGLIVLFEELSPHELNMSPAYFLGVIVSIAYVFYTYYFLKKSS